MSKLDRDAAKDGPLFAPLIFRLALRLEQVPWAEFSSSASEAIYALRAAQRLFKLDATCAWFDTWLEAEAVGMTIERDEQGFCRARPGTVVPPSVEAALSSASTALVIEIIRRTHLETGDSGIALAALSAPATLIDHVAGADARARILSAIDAGNLAQDDADLLDYLRQLSLAMARAYLEAGAGALLLLQDEESVDLAEFDHFVSVFNLAAYYGTPVVLLSRCPISARGRKTLDRLGVDLYAVPGAIAPGIAALPTGDTVDVVPGETDWLALSPWEIDPAVAPATVQAWRRTIKGH